MKQLLRFAFFFFFVITNLSAQTDYTALLRVLQRDALLYAKKPDARPEVLAEAYYKIGKLQVSLKDYNAARAAFEQELLFRRMLPDTGSFVTHKARTMYNLVVQRRLAGNYAEAFALALEAISLNEKHFGRERQETADAHKQLAEVAFLWKRPAFYRKHFDIALQIQKSLIPLDTLKIVNLLILKAGGESETGDYKAGEKILKDALSLLLACSKKDNDLLARLYNNLGSLSEYQHRLTEALQYAKKALDLRLLAGEQQIGVAWLYDNIGVYYQKLKQVEDAILHYRKGFDIYKELLGEKNPKTIELMVHLAGALLEKGEKKEAKNIYEKALHIYDQSDASLHLTLRQLAAIEETEGNSDRALLYLQQVEADFLRYYGAAHPDLAGLYHDFSLFYSRKANRERALHYLQKSLAAGRIAGKIVDKKLQLQNLSALLLQANVQISETLIEEAFALGMQLLSECRQDADRQNALNDIHDFFEALLFFESKQIGDKALGEKQFDHLFRCFERGKSLLLAKSLSEADALQAAAVPDSLQLKYKDLKNNAVYFEQQWLAAEFSKDTVEIDYLRNEAGHFSEALEKMQLFLKKEYPQFSFSWAANTALPTLAELRLFLKTDELLLNYFVGKQHSFLLVLSRNELIFKVIDSSSMKVLPLFLTQFYQPDLLESNLPKALSEYLQYGTKISEALLPTAAQLKGIRRLTIIPDGVLSYLPFEALLYKNVAVDSAAFDNLPYLLHRYSLRYAYNILLLKRQLSSKPDSEKSTMSAFAPYYASETEEHLPLPGAVAELNMLQKKYEGRFFIDEKITKKQLVKELQQAPDFLHLAMHAFAPDSSEAFLLLSKQEKEEDGRLWMRELMLLPLERTQLLVLSACQTGMGSFRRGEGLMSLGRGFAYSGVGAMLTTLWPLHDHAAEQLMRAFYNYLDKGYDKAEALRLAKLDFIAEAGALSAHPVFWASPLFWGNEAALQLPKAKAKIWSWSLLAIGFIALLLLVVGWRWQQWSRS